MGRGRKAIIASLGIALGTAVYHDYAKNWPVRIGSYQAQEGRDYMEDTHVIHRGKNGLFLGVYDGHGDNTVSKYLRDRMHEKFLSKIEAGKIVSAAFTESYQEADEDVKAIARDSEGSTAVTAYIPHRQGNLLDYINDRCVSLFTNDSAYVHCKIIHVANVGDSRATMNNGIDAVRLSIDHSTDVAAECDRIMDMWMESCT